MQRLLLFPALYSAFCTSLYGAHTCTVSTPNPVYISHSTALIQWTDSAASITSSQVQIGKATGVYVYTQGPYSNTVGTTTSNIYQVISGLAGGTTYYVLAQSNDGSTLCTSTEVSFTTLAAPTEPVYPAAPATFNTNLPNTSGYTTITSSCANLQTDINTANTNLLSHGTVITLPHGGVCQLSSIAQLTLPVGVGSISITGVNASTNTFTATQSFTANQAVKFEAQTYNTSLGVAGPITPGVTYYVVGSSLTGTTFQVSATSGGSVVSLASYTGSSADIWVIALSISNAANGNFIVVEPDGLSGACPLPPEHVRMNHAFYQPCLATIQVNGHYPQQNYLATLGLSHHVRFVGIEFVPQSLYASGETDPLSGSALLYLTPGSSWLIFDRCYIHGLPAPDRLANMTAEADGAYGAVIDTETLTGYWSPYYTGLTLSATSTVLSWTAGTYAFGNPVAQCSISAGSATLTGGTATGTAYIWVNQSGCTVQIQAPTGTTATCSGCMFGTAGTPAFPKDGNGSYTVGLLGTNPLTSGVWSTSPANQQSYQLSSFWNDAGLGWVMANGPGPIKLQNDSWTGPGIDVYFTADNGGASTPSDIVISQSIFNVPDFYNNTNAASDGRHYYDRNPLEFKTGQRVLVTGNTFQGAYSDVTTVGYEIIFEVNCYSAPNTCRTSDGEISHNTIQHSGGGVQFNATYPGNGGAPTANEQSLQMARMWLHDNWVPNLNGYTQTSKAAFWFGQSNPTPVYAAGNCFAGGWGGEDFLIEHNNCDQPRGSNPWFLYFNTNPVAGVTLRNNISYFGGDNSSQGFHYCDCSLIVNTAYDAGAALNAVLWSDLNTPGYTWADLLVPTYANTQMNTTSLLNTSFASLYPPTVGFGSTTWVGGGGSSATFSTREASMGWVSETYPRTFRYDSPYISGGGTPATDKLDWGVNWNALQSAQYAIGSGPQPLSITATSASINFVPLGANDIANGCGVDYGTDPAFGAGNYTRIAGTGGGSQSVALTALSAHTLYYVRVNCQTNQPVISFVTQ
jgi:hypothetical protein